jgi:predicted nuclease of predicted toxin-antitoxin system
VKIKLDENLPDLVVAQLEGMGHEVDTVADEHLTGRDDEAIWQAAQAEGRFLITQDLDFSDLRRFRPGTHMGVLLLRLSQPGRLGLTSRVVTLFATEAVEQWRGCLVVATDQKVRVRRP